MKTEKEKQILTGEQRHTDHIDNGQRVSRHSLPTHCFYFSSPAFLKTILSHPASGTFGFAQHTSQPFANPKEPLFAYAPTEIRILVNYILTIN
ncbi:MAG: hypothetical protein HWD63_13980 [Candidatus Parvibacillus calidus]|nr:MAG: hypothetical protein HWD63_13980 [Candidatus Parvibacillus calidus]